MSKTVQSYMTPSKLLKPPDPANKIIQLPIKYFLSLPSKTPKLFSSFRSPSVPAQSRPKKIFPNQNLPLFMSEYLNFPEPTKPDVRPKSNLSIKELINRSKVSVKSSEKQKTEYSAIPSAPTQADYDVIQHINKRLNSFYKPYILEISPRAKIRIYSPTPIFQYRQSNQTMRKNKKRKPRFNSISNTEKKFQEFKAKPIVISGYTRTYADKLKKVLEISEAAKLEVMLLKDDEN